MGRNCYGAELLWTRPDWRGMPSLECPPQSLPLSLRPAARRPAQPLSPEPGPDPEPLNPEPEPSFPEAALMLYS